MTTIDPRPGQRLHEIRMHRNLSQSQVARAIGVSTGTIQNEEHARTRLTTDRIGEWARALQCEPVDCMQPPGSPLPRYRRPRYGALVGLVILAAGFDPGLGGPPQLALDLEQLADDLHGIDVDDLA